MFRKTYYSRYDVDQTLDADLHWIEQTKAEFSLGIFMTDWEGVKEKIQKIANAVGLELAVSNSGSGENRLILFTGRKKTEPA